MRSRIKYRQSHLQEHSLWGKLLKYKSVSQFGNEDKQNKYLKQRFSFLLWPQFVLIIYTHVFSYPLCIQNNICYIAHLMMNLQSLII